MSLITGYLWHTVITVTVTEVCMDDTEQDSDSLGFHPGTVSVYVVVCGVSTELSVV